MIQAGKITEYKTYLQKNLSNKRYQHSLNVADECEKLSKFYGCDREKAYLSGLLHDICKEQKDKDLLELVRKSDMNVSEAELIEPKLWHAIAGAEFVSSKFGINDVDVLWAIRLHTSGSENMSRLSEIVYMADLISKDRSFPEVDKLRKLSYTNLDDAVLEALKFTISDLLKKEKLISKELILAYNKYLKIKNEKVI